MRLDLWGMFVFSATLGCSTVIVPIGSESDDRSGRTAGAEGALVGTVIVPEAVLVGVGWFAVGDDDAPGIHAPVFVSSLARLRPGEPRFSIALTSPPPSEAFTKHRYDNRFRAPPYDVSDVLLGTVLALGERDETTNEVAPEAILGSALDVGVAYFSRDGNPFDANDDVTSVANAHGVSATRGYHLYAVDAAADRRVTIEVGTELRQWYSGDEVR